MEKISVGDVVLMSDGASLIISCREKPGLSIKLDMDGVDQLIEFVTTVAGTDFNRRMAFRVPLSDSSQLRTRLKTSAGIFPAKARNISVTGILVEMPEGLVVQVDDLVEVQLQFDGQTFTYEGIVRRALDHSVGIHFPGTMRGEELDPPLELSRLVMELQREWMRTYAGHSV